MVDMSLHSDTLLIPNQLVVSLEAANTNLKFFGLTRPGLEPMAYRTRGEHVKHKITGVIDKYAKKI